MPPVQRGGGPIIVTAAWSPSTCLLHSVGLDYQFPASDYSESSNLEPDRPVCFVTSKSPLSDRPPIVWRAIQMIGLLRFTNESDMKRFMGDLVKSTFRT